MSDLRSDDLSTGAIPALSTSSEQQSSGPGLCHMPQQFPGKTGLAGDAGIDNRNGLFGGGIQLLQVDAMPRPHEFGPHPHPGQGSDAGIDAGIDTRKGLFRDFGGIPLLQIDAVPRPHSPGPPMARCSLEQAYPSVVENLRKFQQSFSPECLGEKAPPTQPFPLLHFPEEARQQSGLPLGTQPPPMAPHQIQLQQNLFSAPVSAPPFSSQQPPAHQSAPHFPPPMHYSAPQLPPLLNNQPPHPPQPNFFHPPSDFTLPNVPLQPFVPLLIPQGKPVLLKLEDPLTKMKENGIKLLNVDMESVRKADKAPTAVSKPDQQQQQRSFLSIEPEPISELSSTVFVPVEDKKKRKLKSKKMQKRPSEKYKRMTKEVECNVEAKPRVKFLDINEGQKKTDFHSSLEVSDSLKLSSIAASPLPLQAEDRVLHQVVKSAPEPLSSTIASPLPLQAEDGVVKSAPEPLSMEFLRSPKNRPNIETKTSSSESIDFPDQFSPLQSLEVRRLHLLSTVRSGDELPATPSADKASAVDVAMKDCVKEEAEVDSGLILASYPPCLDVATPTHSTSTLPPALTPLVYSPTPAVSGRSLPPPPPLSSPSPPTLPSPPPAPPPSPPPPPPSPLSPLPSPPRLITQAVQVALPSDSDLDAKSGHFSYTGLEVSGIKEPTLSSDEGVKETILTTPTTSIGVQVGFDATPPINLNFSDEVDGDDNFMPR